MLSSAVIQGQRGVRRLAQYQQQQWKLLHALSSQSTLIAGTNGGAAINHHRHGSVNNHHQPLVVSSIIGNTPSATIASRSYVSRAHPKPRPVYSISKAMDMILETAEQRRERILKKWEKHNSKRYELPVESVEVAFGLNLDPRKPGQSLRGSISLPHGSGKKLSCLVFTSDEAAAEEALKRGAKHAGGETLIESILSGEISVDKMDVSVATSDLMPTITKKLARTLGPRGLMPNPKTGTLLETSEELLGVLDSKIDGKEIMFRTEKSGGILVGIGRVSFGKEKLLENLDEIIKELHRVKPEQYGKGKINKKATTTKAKYMLRAYLSSTQGPGLKLDLATIDPTGAYYLSEPTKA